MNGSIRQRGENSWQVRVFMGIGDDGNKEYHAFTVKGASKDAERFLREKLHELDRGAYVAPDRRTFQEHAEAWLEDYVQVNVRQTTAESYETLLRKHAFPAFGQMPVAKITPADIQRLLAQKIKAGLSKRRVQYLHRVIHGCLQYAVQLEIVARNVADAVKPPQADKREAPYLTPDQVLDLREAVDGHWLEMVIILAAYTGMRRGEILGLKWEDVDFESRILRVRRSLVPTKTGSKFQEPKTAKGRRSIHLQDSLVAELKRHKARQAAQKLRLGAVYQDNGLVCARDDGTPISPSSVTHGFTLVLEKAGLPKIRFHDMRHTHASLLLTQGWHPKMVQERLGHSTINLTLDTYSHVMPILHQEAAQRLDEFLPVRRPKANSG